MSRKKNARPLEETADFSLAAGKPVIVGLSGGADSVALAYWLRESGALLIAAHVNHGLRGEESDRDEAFVREFCRKIDIPLRVRRLDIGAMARKDGIGLEECGRRERYAFFEELAEKWDENAVIATAHTLSDNLETLLFRIARGTALEGLCGIPPVRGRIIRPLLGCSRQAVEDYCRRKGLTFVTDSTNADPSYARNRIRAQAVPALLEVNSAAEEHAGQLMETLRQDREYLDSQAETLYLKARNPEGLSLKILRKAPACLVSRVAARYLREQNVQPDYWLLEDVQKLIFQETGSVNLSAGRKLRAARGFLRTEEPVTSQEQFSAELPKEPEKDGFLANLTLPEGERLRFQVVSAKDIESVKKIYKNDLIFCVDYDTIIGKLLFRNRLPGDQIVLPRREGSRLLKKLYSQLGLTPRQRQTAWVLADDSGVVWAEYTGPSERAVPGQNAMRLLTAVRSQQQEGAQHND